MLSIAHTLASLPLAVWLENPLIIFTTAFVWHLLCDTLPHWNIYPDKFARYPVLLVASDVIGGVVIAWLLLGDSLLTLPFLAAIAGGNTPDVLHGLWDLAPISLKHRLTQLTPWFRWHNRLQLETDHIPAGLVSQVAVVILAMALL